MSAPIQFSALAEENAVLLEGRAFGGQGCVISASLS